MGVGWGQGVNLQRPSVLSLGPDWKALEKRGERLGLQQKLAGLSSVI